MSRFKSNNPQQDAFVCVRFDDQILPGTFEFALHHLMERHVDLSAFEALYNNDTCGARAYHPKVLLKIVLFGYARGLIGSRRIERACRTNVQFMALSGEATPDHSTLAAFISRSPDAIKSVFREVLLVCDDMGLIGREHFAIDGVKLPSNASKDWSGTLEELQAKADKLDRAVERMLKAHELADASEAQGELESHAAKQIAKLTRHSDKLKAFLETAQPKPGVNGERKSNVTDNDSAKLATSKGVMQGYTAVAVTDDKHQIICQADAYGVPQEQELLQPILGDLQASFQALNLADNVLAEVKLTADAGFHSADNLDWLEAQQCDAYVADNRFRKRDPRFVDADKYKAPAAKPSRFQARDFDYDARRLTCTCPAGKALYRNGSNVKINGRSGIKFTAPKSACRGCHLRANCLRSADQQSPRQVVFFKDPAIADANAVTRMKAKIDSSVGRMIYSKRLGTVEPPFGNLRYHKGMDRFTLRSRAKVDGQWKLFAMVQNIEKIAHVGKWG